jgi:hypothetical protein
MHSNIGRRRADKMASARLDRGHHLLGRLCASHRLLDLVVFCELQADEALAATVAREEI